MWPHHTTNAISPHQLLGLERSIVQTAFSGENSRTHHTDWWVGGAIFIIFCLKRCILPHPVVVWPHPAHKRLNFRFGFQLPNVARPGPFTLQNPNSKHVHTDVARLRPPDVSRVHVFVQERDNPCCSAATSRPRDVTPTLCNVAPQT